LRTYIGNIELLYLVCETTFEYVQLHLSMYNYIWVCTTTFEYVQLHLSMYNYIWVCATTYSNTLQWYKDAFQFLSKCVCW